MSARSFIRGALVLLAVLGALYIASTHALTAGEIQFITDLIKYAQINEMRTRTRTTTK